MVIVSRQRSEGRSQERTFSQFLSATMGPSVALVSAPRTMPSLKRHPTMVVPVLVALGNGRPFSTKNAFLHVDLVTNVYANAICRLPIRIWEIKTWRSVDRGIRHDGLWRISVSTRKTASYASQPPEPIRHQQNHFPRSIVIYSNTHRQPPWITGNLFKTACPASTSKDQLVNLQKALLQLYSKLGSV